jgi:hypothetical protein
VWRLFTRYKDLWVRQMNLTKRGRRVRAGLLTALILATVWLLNDMTTPDQCKVEVENLSQFCIDLLYP